MENQTEQALLYTSDQINPELLPTRRENSLNLVVLKVESGMPSTNRIPHMWDGNLQNSGTEVSSSYPVLRLYQGLKVEDATRMSQLVNKLYEEVFKSESGYDRTGFGKRNREEILARLDNEILKQNAEGTPLTKMKSDFHEYKFAWTAGGAAQYK